MSVASVSYGGGVQSTALLVLAAQRRIEFRLFLFANVGDDSEHPATLHYVHELAAPYAAAHGIELVELHRVPARGQAAGTVETLYGRLTRPGSRSVPIPVRMANGAHGTRSCSVDCTLARQTRRHPTPHPPPRRGAHHPAALQRPPRQGEQPMTPRPGWLGAMVHRWDRGRTLPAHSRALFVAAALRSLVGVRPLERRSTCSAIANGIDEGRQADDPARGKDNKTLSGPRRPPDRAVPGNVLNHRHHDVADNNYSRQDRRDGQTEGHTGRPTGPPVTTIREHVGDGSPHQTAILSGRPDQTSPRLSRSRVPTKPSGQLRQVQTSTADFKVRVIGAELRRRGATAAEPATVALGHLDR